MTTNNRPLMYRAVTGGNVSEALRLLDEDPDLRIGPYSDWLTEAIRSDQLAMVEALIGAGFDVNCGKPIDRPLERAVRRSKLEMVRCLLDHGAEINQTGAKGGGTIIGAVNEGSLEIVKLLIERGADPNLSYGVPPRNALSHAIMYGHTDIADFLRARGVQEPHFEPPTQGGGLREEVLRYMENCVGKVEELALSEIVPLSSPSISLHVIAPQRPWEKKVIFTTGMTDEAMNVPAGGENFRFAELVVYLPSDWPLDLKSLRDPRNSWPIDWLRRIARYSQENDTWLGRHGTIVTNGEPPEPFAPGVPFSSWLLVPSPPGLESFQADDGRSVVIYLLFPLYPEERKMEMSRGLVHLVEQFDRLDIDLAVDLNRPNVATVSGLAAAVPPGDQTERAEAQSGDRGT